MPVIALPENVMRILDVIPGETRQDRLVNLVLEGIVAKLKECDARIVGFEAKYGMSFEDFRQAWKQELLGSPLSYSLEKDYMEWEGFCLERKKWLSLLKELKDGIAVKG